jgi:hypothetical protein
VSEPVHHEVGLPTDSVETQDQRWAVSGGTCPHSAQVPDGRWANILGQTFPATKANSSADRCSPLLLSKRTFDRSLPVK